MGEDQDLICMFDSLMALEDDAKAIKDEIKDTLETYAKNKDKNPKSVKSLFQKYKEYKKDPETFILVDFEVDQMLNAVVREYAKEGDE